jgi:pSer/pThr/pTyr-binding forkhead associated (FHA) protein
MSARITLTATAGPLIGRHFDFDTPTVCTVGRSKDCLLRLPNTPTALTASRHHCEIIIDPPEVAVRDLGSTNGTYLNGAEVSRQPPGQLLHDGDRLRVGSSSFHVSFKDAPDRKAARSGSCETCR